MENEFKIMKMENEFKIENGIPIPGEKRGRPTKYPFKEMKVGDSFIISDTYSRRIMIQKYACARNWGNYQSPKIKFRVQKTDDDEIRVWRIQ